MNASSSGFPDEVKWEIVRHSIYICQGICIIVFNSLIILTICRQHALRSMKEYTMLGALAFADSVAGLGTLLAGIHFVPVHQSHYSELFVGLHRLPLWLTERNSEPASGRYCLLTGHNLLWVWFDPASHVMLIAVSLDRALSVLVPLKYNTLNNTYAFLVLAIAFGATLVMAVMNWSNVEPVHYKICWTIHAYGINGNHLRDLTNAVATLASIVLYMCVPIVYRNRVTPANNNSAESRRANFQKRLNKSIAISCVFTFVCVALPWIINVCLLNKTGQDDDYESIAVWMFIVSNINPMVNLFIYYHKQIYFKVAFKALFKNKTLPLNLNNWQISAS